MVPVLPQIEPPTFEYAVVETCPAEAEARALFPESPGRTRVVVWFDGRTFGGRVVFLDPDHAPAERTLNGPSCKVVLEALALSMAVARDVEAHKRTPAVDGPSARSEPPESAPPTTPTPTSSFLRGADLGAASWIGSQPSVALAASLAIVVGSTRPEHGVWAPRLRVGYAASFPTSARIKSDTDGGDESSAFYSFVTRLDGCPIELGNQRVAFSPCLRQDLGVLVGTAPNLGRRVNDFVGSTGLSTLTQFWLARDSRWYLGLELAALVSWRHLRYSSVDFQISPIVGQFGLSVGVSTK